MKLNEWCQCNSTKWRVVNGAETLSDGSLANYQYVICDECGELYPDPIVKLKETINRNVTQMDTCFSNLWSEIAEKLTSEQSNTMNNVVNGFAHIKELTEE